MKIGFVVTNYNNSIHSLSFIDSVMNASYLLDYFIVIVDNCSKESEFLILKNKEKNSDKLIIIKNEENSGYFEGLNIGLRYIKKYHSEIKFIVIGNNDILLDKNFFHQFYNNITIFEKYPVVSPNIITTEGQVQNPHVLKKISKFREFVYDLYYFNYFFSKIILLVSKITKLFTDRNDEKHYQFDGEIYQGHGSCYLIGPLFLSNFSELFAPTFLMGEEFFLAYQLKLKNYSIYYTPNIKITHLGHASLKKVPSKQIWEISKISHKVYKKYLKLYNKI